MEKLSTPNSLAAGEKAIAKNNDPTEGSSQIRSELILLHKKYARLEQKEKRLQVS